MGWQDYHLYSFEIRGIEFGEPFERDWDLFLDSTRTAIEDLELSTGDTFTYTYDFGDFWKHVITVEGVGSAEDGVSYPRCLAGARACPPEDSGGPGGYAELVRILSDPRDEEYDSMRTWDGAWEPEHFDLAPVNRRLATLPALKTKRRTLKGIAELVMLTGAWHLLTFCIQQRDLEDTPKYLEFERRGSALTLFEILMPDARYNYARQSRVARFRFERDDECWHLDRPTSTTMAWEEEWRVPPAKDLRPLLPRHNPESLQPA
jgi:hypothetical protein